MVFPRAVVLDVNETLFSLEALDRVFQKYGLDGLRDLWFARTLRTGFGLTCMDSYRTFSEVACQTFAALAPDRIGSVEQDSLLTAFGALDVHADVRPALTSLRDADVPTVTLSVGNAANVERLFRRAGLDHLVPQHLSCESVQRWKPAPEPYLHACAVLGLEPGDVWLIAAHSWDIGGAAAVGLRTAWIPRLEGVFDASFGRPDVSGVDLIAVVEELLDVSGDGA